MVFNLRSWQVAISPVVCPENYPSPLGQSKLYLSDGQSDSIAGYEAAQATGPRTLPRFTWNNSDFEGLQIFKLTRLGMTRHWWRPWFLSNWGTFSRGQRKRHDSSDNNNLRKRITQQASEHFMHKKVQLQCGYSTHSACIKMYSRNKGTLGKTGVFP